MPAVRVLLLAIALFPTALWSVRGIAAEPDGTPESKPTTEPVRIDEPAHSPAGAADAPQPLLASTSLPDPGAVPGLCPVVGDLLVDYCREWPHDPICQP